MVTNYKKISLNITILQTYINSREHTGLDHVLSVQLIDTCK